jgi:hypothetical protein
MRWFRDRTAGISLRYENFSFSIVLPMLGNMMN